MDIPEISLEMVAGLLRPPAWRVRFPGKFPETCFAQTPQISKRISRNLRQGQRPTGARGGVNVTNNVTDTPSKMRKGGVNVTTTPPDMLRTASSM